MATVVCLGELLIDMVSEAADASLPEATRFLKAPGGAPANVAVGLSRLGVPSAFVGAVGDDPFGEFLRATLDVENVDTAHLLSTQDARTSIAFVATRRDGKKDICFYRNPGADAALRPEDLATNLFNDARLFHCGSVTLSQSPAREAQFEAAARARDNGVLVSFDPNWRPSIWDDFEVARNLIWQMMMLSDIVKVADEEWEFITGTTDFEAGSKRICEAGPKLVVITRGADGAYFNFAQNGQTISGEIAGLKVNAVDTLGAGDSFVAGFLSQALQFSSLDEFLTEENVSAALRFANACGALATQKPGAIPALPTKEEAEEFLASQ